MENKRQMETRFNYQIKVRFIYSIIIYITL